MRFSIIAAATLQLAVGFAAPTHFHSRQNEINAFNSGEGARGGRGAGGEAAAGAKAGEAAGGKAGEAAGGKAGEAAGGEGEGEGEGKENELELKGNFDEAVTLEGGDIKQDTTFPPGVCLLLALSLWAITC